MKRKVDVVSADRKRCFRRVNGWFAIQILYLQIFRLLQRSKGQIWKGSRVCRHMLCVFDHRIMNRSAAQALKSETVPGQVPVDQCTGIDLSLSLGRSSYLGFVNTSLAADMGLPATMRPSSSH